MFYYHSIEMIIITARLLSMSHGNCNNEELFLGTRLKHCASRHQLTIGLESRKFSSTLNLV